MLHAKWSQVRLLRLKAMLLVLLFAVCTPVLRAGSARFVAGQGWGVHPGASVVWATATVQYFTDAGALSPTVSHAAADTMVAAAAAVWSVPTSSIAFAQGGTLAEDVSVANVTSNGEQITFPADLQTSNEGQVPVAIVYDEDGSLIDLLLGEGASEPDGCRQNAVVGDVDDINQDDGTLRHATLILNGRCVGAAPEQLTQMQYQLARAFGRVLGVSWSQTNDNVFTAQTTVTANQIAYWPLMHPMDVICGNYTYQCMTNPFTLRPDDLNTLALLYPVYQGSVPAGKQGSSDDALYLWGNLTFPAGQGMDWVNIVARRNNNGFNEDWQTVSATTGSMFRQALATPENDAAPANSGTGDPWYEGYFLFRRVPLNGISDVFFTTEAINPLYIGDAAIGPYVRPPATPSGAAVTFVDWSARTNGDGPVGGPVSASTDAASVNVAGGDGSEQAPAAFAPAGWQSGLLGSWGHNSWWSFPVAAGHQWTLEVTATDEAGAATLNKVQPIAGIWRATDDAGVLPTVGTQTAPFNSLAPGVTQMVVDGPETVESYRVSISDQFGAGRPDFTYVARVLYADSVTPATIGTSGGQVTLTGTGFQQGNQVLVHNVPARVLSLTATQIVVQVPSSQTASAALGSAVSVLVVDTGTGGLASIPNALTYVVLPNVVEQVSAPAGLLTGVTASTPFAVRVVASDGVTPVANAAISLRVLSGSAQLGSCSGRSVCVLRSGSDGVLQTTVTGGAPGSVVLQAREIAGGSTVQVTLTDNDPVRSVNLDQSSHYVAAGASGSWERTLTVVQNGAAGAGVAVTWTSSSHLQQASAQGTTAADGTASATFTATALAAGATETVTGCAWSSVCATWTLHSVDPADWMLHASGTTAQQVPTAASFAPITLQVTDANGNALEGATVSIYQRVLAASEPCVEVSRCPAAPVLKTSQSTTVSDRAGLVSLTPLEVSGIPQTVEIAVATGSYGFLTLTLTKTP